MRYKPVQPRQTNAEIGTWALRHLNRVVAIDSASDERSPTIPSTPGQAVLAEDVGQFYVEQGADVTTDAHANVIAQFAGRGIGAGQTPIAMMVHLDTARGTAAVSGLDVLQKWDGSRVPYRNNRDLHVDAETYPDAHAFLGHDIVHGPGDAPFGLDDKLGLTHLMTLARLLAENPEAPHPPLLLIGRPDEEVGRMEAVQGLAASLAEQGVDFGYTIDGILPYEVNLENFNASQATIRFLPQDPAAKLHEQRRFVRVTIGGVNTHGCTAKAEGYRAATRLCSEVLEVLVKLNLAPHHVAPVRFESHELRDCDATVDCVLHGDDADRLSNYAAALNEAVAAVVEPHVRRGASYQLEDVDGPLDVTAAGSTWAALDYIATLLADDVGFPVAAEASDGHDGYSNPYRARNEDGACVVDIRLRDFSGTGLQRREAHLRDVLHGRDHVHIEITQQYVNMAPRLANRPELLELPQWAARSLDFEAPMLPIRGGTGVDPFLDHGVPIANLGTGYFAPESEKEFTSLQHMAGHARWLFALVQLIAFARNSAQSDDEPEVSV